MFPPGSRRRCSASTTAIWARAGTNAAREARIWEGIENVDDGELWETHLSLKSRLLDFVRRRAMEQAERRGEPQETMQRLGRVLSPDALTIGFARRFATYKRANLILADIEKLASMVNDPKRPVQFVFAGKAHPHDEPGKRVLQQIAELMRDPNLPTSSSSSKTTTSTSAGISCRASTSG